VHEAVTRFAKVIWEQAVSQGRRIFQGKICGIGQSEELLPAKTVVNFTVQQEVAIFSMG